MKQMLVQGQGNMLQTAILEDGRLVEFFMEKSEEGAGQLVGSIYKGRIVNVLPGMQAAFVDIGLAKNAFLYIDDVLHPHLERQPKEKPAIAQLLKTGQEVVVQVMKEPLGSKGARVTTHVSLPGRFLVYMPVADYVGVSKKVTSDHERSKLRSAGESIRGPGEGVIMRTAAEGESIEALQADVCFLRELWQGVDERAKHASAPVLLHREAGLVRRLVRDLLSSEMDEVWIDHSGSYAETEALMEQMAPSFLSRLRLYREQASGTGQLLNRYQVNLQLKQAFERRILLDCGGDLVWDQTEALTVIDVNTGKFVGTSDLEDTVFRTNMEAAEQIARLLRLRDVGGIIIIDFIDMEQEEHRGQILQRLETLVRRDRTKCQVVGWTKLGLLELTRKKVREHAVHQLLQTCSVCKGRGKV
jgi:ribonuclease G